MSTLVPPESYESNSDKSGTSYHCHNVAQIPLPQPRMMPKSLLIDNLLMNLNKEIEMIDTIKLYNDIQQGVKLEHLGQVRHFAMLLLVKCMVFNKMHECERIDRYMDSLMKRNDKNWMLLLVAYLHQVSLDEFEDPNRHYA